MSRIGFILLTHAKPPQMLRLVERLNSMFGQPPIVCHHDFGKCPLPDGFLPQNVEFVQPHLSTGWAEFSVVKATAIALEQMYRRADAPDWCVTLSGSCYPTKPAAQILANLEAGGYDAHFDGLDLDPKALHTGKHELYFSRYCVKEHSFRSLDKRLRPRMRRIRLPQFVMRRFLPYHDRLRCFAGSQWFTVSRRAAEYIIAFQTMPDAEALKKYYQSIEFSDESYFQTIVYNAPDLKIHSDNWLYLDWSEKQYHPKTLTVSDLEALRSSPAHFARKFDSDAHPDVLDALDRIIDDGAIDDGAIDNGTAGGPHSCTGALAQVQASD